MTDREKIFWLIGVHRGDKAAILKDAMILDIEQCVSLCLPEATDLMIEIIIKPNTN